MNDRKNYVFDMDGTLSIVGDRLECLQRDPKDWDEFYNRCDEDRPNWPICALLYYIASDTSATVKVWILSGRRESCREKTLAWLRRNNMPVDTAHLIMRPDGDFRHDTIVKPEMLADLSINPYMVFEDRSSMVEYWRSKGVCCVQVANGNF